MRSEVMVMMVGAGIASAAIGQGCSFTEQNPGHCFNNGGDEYCRTRDPSRPFCERGQDECISSSNDLGCVAERPVDSCYSPCGGRATLDENGECLMGEESSSGSTSEGMTGETGTTTEGSSTTGPQPCLGNDDCTDAATPFCEPDSGQCVRCDGVANPDGACAEADATNPLCIEGACVACTPENPAVCDDQLLLCDGDTNACVPCTEHGQCGSGACELAMGRCFPEDFVVHVDGDGGQDYTSIAAAVGDVDDGLYGVIVVHELDGAASYQTAGGLTIGGGKTIALLAAPGEAPIIQGTGTNPGLRVEVAGTTVYVDGLSVSGNTGGLGIQVDEAFAWLDRSRVVQNSGGGIVAQNSAELTLRNCFVGGGAQDVDALALNGSSLEMLYTTVGGGGVLGGRARALFCEGASMANVRNSILVSADPMPEVECTGVTITNSATETDVGNLDIGWFNGYAAGDFSLTTMGMPSGASVFANVAVWQAGDPDVDIDGTPRPTTDGAMDFAGADAVP
ncbi:MAG: hypothetical protein KC501_39840 [Myxococcales bacterium]|nr:hypothetical protein [Myxococcales bacterium]